MRIEDLREAKNRRPFVPFRIVLVGGEPIPIVHPDAVAWGDRDKPKVVIAAS
jgi:hypothetical protein